MSSRDDCLHLDARDPLAPARHLFALERVDAEGVIYLDGNSLGVLPRAAINRLATVVNVEWGSGLIRSWNTAGWISLSQRIGDKIAALIGAHAGEVIAADSTSINLFKALSAAAWVGPDRPHIISERTNFPTDLYIADTFAREHGKSLVLVEEDAILPHLDDRAAILMLTHVNYRTGRMHAMRELTRAAHDAGAIVVRSGADTST
jgi:kynureninase